MAGEWEERSLSSLCVYLNRGAAPVYTDTGGILVLNQKCVRDQRVDFTLARRTDSNRKPVAADRMVQPLDILVNSTGVGTLGRVAQVRTLPEMATVDSHVTLVRPDSRVVDPLYLGLAIRCFESEIEVLGEGSTGQTELSRARLGAFLIPMPISLEEQRAIAHFLGTLDDKIELNRRRNQTLEAMGRALFKDWFVDFGPVRAKMEGRARQDGARSGQPRTPQASDLPWPGAEAGAGAQGEPYLPADIWRLFPDRLDDEGKPEGWKMTALKDVTTELRRGISPSYSELGGVCVLNQKCIRNHEINFGLARRHDHSKRNIEGRAVRAGDILVNSTGVGTLGRVAQLWNVDEPTVVDSHVSVVRPNTDIVSVCYLGLNLTSRETEIEMLGEGSTGQTELSRVRLGSLPVLMPPREVLDNFDAYARPLLDAVMANTGESTTLAQLRDTLLPKLISGELRVKDAERFIERAG